MIQIMTQDMAGGTSPDAETLFQAMNVPTQGSVLGEGKTIQLANKDMTFICSQGPKGRQCTLMIQKRAASEFNPAEKIVHYEVSGEAAKWLHSKFHVNDQGTFRLVTSDGYFGILVEPQTFTLVFDGRGL